RMIRRYMALVPKQNLYSRPVDQFWVLRRALGKDGMQSLRSGPTRECYSKAPAVVNRSLRAYNKFVGSCTGYVGKIFENADGGFGHDLPFRHKYKHCNSATQDDFRLCDAHLKTVLCCIVQTRRAGAGSE